MAKPYRIPDFKKMYPEASEEVIAVLRTTERKMQYQEYDLKTEQTVVDEENQTVTVIPSREDSYERLMEASVQFAGESLSTEEQVLRRMEVEQLHKALSFLSDDERYLICQIYFEERTERALAKELYLSQKGINKRKGRILEKLRELMKNF
ncbi:MAG: sigma-70 family RNA polymerase sigma factor [Enterocloster citroniae]|nr:sigma-70 family RNA polymerase sigma factor [Enterocloster citroniae]